MWNNIRESKSWQFQSQRKAKVDSCTLREKQDVKEIQGLLTYSNKVYRIQSLKKSESLHIVGETGAKSYTKFTFLIPLSICSFAFSSRLRTSSMRNSPAKIVGNRLRFSKLKEEKRLYSSLTSSSWSCPWMSWPWRSWSWRSWPRRCICRWPSQMQHYWVLSVWSKLSSCRSLFETWSLSSSSPSLKTCFLSPPDQWSMLLVVNLTILLSFWPWW